MEDYYSPADAERVALLLWKYRSDKEHMAPIVVPPREGADSYLAGVWPRTRVSELPPGAWIVEGGE